MGTITATLFQGLMNDSDISATNAERCIDQGINLLNSYGAAIDNLTGSAGSKTGSYTSAQEGAIMTLAKEIYARFYKNAGDSNLSVGGISVVSTSDATLLRNAKQLAWQLKTRSFVST